ncbi:MAG: O-methyltransferase [Marinilabiliaceae bacterium]|nr:O-methyltransferase [Marinilabiliaceae bacterium]
MEERISKYIEEHSSPESEVLHELYRKTYTSAVNPNMISGNIQGQVLGMLVSMSAPSKILEIGTYTGYSAISMALEMKQGSVLHTIEKNDELYELSCSFFKKAGVSDKIIMHTGDARDIIPTLDKDFDMIFIDGDKREYPEYLDLVLPHIKKGGFIIADNVLWDGKVCDLNTNDPMTLGIQKFNKLVKENSSLRQVILPLRDGLMLIRKC